MTLAHMQMVLDLRCKVHNKLVGLDTSNMTEEEYDHRCRMVAVSWKRYANAKNAYNYAYATGAI